MDHEIIGIYFMRPNMKSAAESPGRCKHSLEIARAAGFWGHAVQFCCRHQHPAT